MTRFDGWLKRELVYAMVSMAISCLWQQARAGGLSYSTGFEAPEWTARTPVAGQNGWVNVFGQSTAVITTTNPAIGTQALLIPGTDLRSTGGGIDFSAYRPDSSVFHVNP